MSKLYRRSEVVRAEGLARERVGVKGGGQLRGSGDLSGGLDEAVFLDGCEAVLGGGVGGCHDSLGDCCADKEERAEGEAI